MGILVQQAILHCRGSMIGLLSVLLLGVPTIADAFEVPIGQIVRNSPVSGTVALLRPPTMADGRLRTDLRIVIPDLFSALDRLGQQKGNMGSCSRRLFWVGPTRVIGTPTTAAIRLGSRARYEQWTCGWITTRVFRDTKSVDLTLVPRWDNGTRRLDLVYRIDNIHNFPGEAEQWLRRAGLLSGRTSVSAGGTGDFDRLDPRVVSWSPSSAARGNGLAFDVAVDVSAAEALRLALERFGRPEVDASVIPDLLRLLGLRG